MGRKMYAVHDYHVAPYAGAWIEILILARLILARQVAPYAGAWIEISRVAGIKRARDGRSLRGSVD